MSMKWSQNIDDQIKYAVKKEAKKMQEEQQLYGNIRKQIYAKGREENMKNRRIKNKAMLVGAMTMVLIAGTTWAARISGWDMQLINFYGEYPTPEKIKGVNDFLPKFVEELPGEYKFMMASMHKGELIDKYSHVSDEGNELILRYFAPGEEDEGHAIAFFATDIMDHHYFDGIKKYTEEYKGIVLEFSDWRRKYVSSDYKITEEEQKQIDEKILFIENTEDEDLLKEGIEHKQQIAWIEDGIGYTILSANNHQFTQAECIEMAKKVIDSK